MRVVDADGNDVPAGEVGELWIQGPNVVKGYWGMPEATEQAFGGGWFKSGDLARVDDEGFVYIVDRAKDMVIRGGENVYCAEVEAVLFEHPGCRRRRGHRRAAPGARRRGRRGRGRACRARGVTADDLRAHVAEHLAVPSRCPAHVYFRDEPLPRNPAGKVLKRDLREELAGA